MHSKDAVCCAMGSGSAACTWTARMLFGLPWVHLLRIQKLSLSCLQIALGAFSDLSAFEVQSIAQMKTGVSIIGQALQVRAFYACTVCSVHSMMQLSMLYQNTN